MTRPVEVAHLRTEVRSWLGANAPARGSADDFSAAHIVSATTREEFEVRERAALTVARNDLCQESVSVLRPMALAHRRVT